MKAFTGIKGALCDLQLHHVFSSKRSHFLNISVEAPLGPPVCLVHNVFHRKYILQTCLQNNLQNLYEPDVNIHKFVDYIT